MRFFIGAISRKLSAPYISFSAGSESQDEFIEAFASCSRLTGSLLATGLR
jgi:hypothetical protein